MKKISLRAINGVFIVKQVSNSVEWIPGDTLKETQVQSLIRRPQLEVVITQ